MTARNILIGLMAFLGIGAVFGGAVFIISPYGQLFKMPVSMLRHSPFSSFLVPGIILFTVLGVAPLVLIFALVKKPACPIAAHFNICRDMYWAWTYCIYIAFALIIWIQTEMTVLQAVHWSHTLYMFVAMANIFVLLLPPVRALYKIHANDQQ